MIHITRITPGNIAVFKAVRLRALQDAPLAFGSTYEQEARLTESDWLARVERMEGETAVGFLAMDGESACGMAGSFLEEDDPKRAQLISMWTAATHRQQGVGRRLVDEVLKWAKQRGASSLYLMVTGINESAIRFYDRLGFTRTGRTEPYPNDPAIVEYEMSRPIP